MRQNYSQWPNKPYEEIVKRMVNQMNGITHGVMGGSIGGVSELVMQGPDEVRLV